MTVGRWVGTGAEPGGMGRDEAAALVREVSASHGYRGSLQRLAGGSPEGPVWAVRVTALFGGAGGLLRSREAWVRYRAQQWRGSRQAQDQGAQEARAMVDLVETRDAGPRNGAVAPDLDGDVDAEQMTHSFEEAAKRAVRGSPLERWRRLTEEAIAEEERDAGRLLLQADRLRERAAQKRLDARRLRRALAVGAPSDAEDGGADGSIRSRVLAWTRAHGGALVLSVCAEELGLSIKRASDAASQLRADAQLIRVGKGQYRLVALLGSTAQAGEEAGNDGG